MKFSNIMVPYDGSEHAKNALAYAKDLVANDPEAKITIVHAVPSSYVGADALNTAGSLDGVPYGMLDYEEYQGIVQRVLDEAKANVEKDLAADLEGFGDRLQVAAVAATSPADALARFAEKNGCDLIVMGRRGLGAIRGMLGSVSFGVLRSTEIPVLTVK